SAERRLLGSSRSAWTTSTPRTANARAASLAGLRLATRTANLPAPRSASTTPPPCRPVPPSTATTCLVIIVSLCRMRRGAQGRAAPARRFSLTPKRSGYQGHILAPGQSHVKPRTISSDRSVACFPKALKVLRYAGFVVHLVDKTQSILILEICYGADKAEQQRQDMARPRCQAHQGRAASGLYD